jgi:hypothetical protein
MHRQPEHVMMFLLAEMGTNGSLDGQQRLVIKGRFAPKKFEAILRRYISKLSSSNVSHLSKLMTMNCFFFISIYTELITRNGGWLTVFVHKSFMKFRNLLFDLQCAFKPFR